MSLKDDVYGMLQKFNDADSESVLAILLQIQPHLKSNITQKYLGEKIHAVKMADTESERKKMCKALIPYLNWYVQGN
ncbi:MAG: hypothetical protein OXC46_10490 [Thaumarchaeota archaeon]|nr:hypothetical protein [Nitrososphaerota archaeon]